MRRSTSCDTCACACLFRLWLCRTAEDRRPSSSCTDGTTPVASSCPSRHRPCHAWPDRRPRHHRRCRRYHPLELQRPCSLQPESESASAPVRRVQAWCQPPVRAWEQHRRPRKGRAQARHPQPLRLPAPAPLSLPPQDRLAQEALHPWPAPAAPAAPVAAAVAGPVVPTSLRSPAPAAPGARRVALVMQASPACPVPRRACPRPRPLRRTNHQYPPLRLLLRARPRACEGSRALCHRCCCCNRQRRPAPHEGASEFQGRVWQPRARV